MPRDDAPLDLGIARVDPPALVAEAFVEPDRGALGVAQVEVEDRETELAGQPLEIDEDAAPDPAAARPGRDEEGADRAGEGLRLVVARRARQLHRAGDNPVEPADDEAPLGH